MLTDKNDNRFLNVLSDIDDNLVDSITGASVEPETVSPPPKRTRIFKIAVPVAASLALAAAVGIGALIMGNRLHNPQSGLSSQSDEITADTTPDFTIGSMDIAVMEPPQEGDLGNVPYLDINLVPNITDYKPDNTETALQPMEQAIINVQKCGDCNVLLIGNGIWKNTDAFADDVILVRELELVLAKSGTVISTEKVFDPLDPDAFMFTLTKDYFECYTEIAVFGENEYMAIFRSIKVSRPISEALFFFISNETMHLCKRADLASDAKREERSETLGPPSYVFTDKEATPGAEQAAVNYTLTDQLTGTKYAFWHIGGETYYTEGKYSYNDYCEKPDLYPLIDLNALPVIDEFTYADVGAVLGNLVLRGVICYTEIGEYHLDLIGQNIRRNSSGLICLYNPQLVISKNGKYIGSVCPQLATIPDGSSVVIDSDNLFKAYIMDDMTRSLLIITDSNLDNSYFGEGCFSAVMDDGSLVNLHGWPDMSGSQPPAWTEGKQGYSLIVHPEDKTVICGFKKYTFDLEQEGMWNYTVSWLDGPIDTE